MDALQRCWHLPPHGYRCPCRALSCSSQTCCMPQRGRSRLLRPSSPLVLRSRFLSLPCRSGLCALPDDLCSRRLLSPSRSRRDSRSLRPSRCRSLRCSSLPLRLRGSAASASLLDSPSLSGRSRAPARELPSAACPASGLGTPTWGSTPWGSIISSGPAGACPASASCSSDGGSGGGCAGPAFGAAGITSSGSAPKPKGSASSSTPVSIPPFAAARHTSELQHRPGYPLYGAPLCCSQVTSTVAGAQQSAPSSAAGCAVPLAAGSSGGGGGASGASQPNATSSRITRARARMPSSAPPSLPMESWNSCSTARTPASVRPCRSSPAAQSLRSHSGESALSELAAVIIISAASARMSLHQSA